MWMMSDQNVEQIKAYFQDDNFCKKDIGLKIKDFRCGSMFVDRDTLSRRMDYSFCTLTNIETGKYYPKIEMVSRLVNVSNTPIYYVLGQKLKIQAGFHENRQFDQCTEDMKIRILMRLLSEKCNKMELYEEKMIGELCRPKKDINKDRLGYLMMFERERRGIRKSELASWLGVREKKISDMEKGNASVSFKKLYFISCLFEAPVDLFIMESLTSKQYIINYLLSEVFGDADEKKHEFYRRYIDTFRYKYENI